MTVHVTSDVFCDRCGNWVHGGVSTRVDRIGAWRVARDKGWIRRRVDGILLDLCPECKEEAPE